MFLNVGDDLDDRKMIQIQLMYVARRASGRPPGHIFGPKICIFLRYTYETPIFSAQTDLTQWDYISPIS